MKLYFTANPAKENAPLDVTAAQAGVLFNALSDARSAAHYRAWKQVVGVDADFVPVGSPTDSDFTLTGLPSSAAVKVRVTAVNDAVESQPSATAQDSRSLNWWS